MKNKYFVRDIYFILGIIYDFQFAIEFSTPPILFPTPSSASLHPSNNYRQYQ